jgi:hypothetical protein
LRKRWPRTSRLRWAKGRMPRKPTEAVPSQYQPGNMLTFMIASKWAAGTHVPGFQVLSVHDHGRDDGQASENLLRDSETALRPVETAYLCFASNYRLRMSGVDGSTWADYCNTSATETIQISHHHTSHFQSHDIVPYLLRPVISSSLGRTSKTLPKTVMTITTTSSDTDFSFAFFFFGWSLPPAVSWSHRTSGLGAAACATRTAYIHISRWNTVYKPS